MENSAFSQLVGFLASVVFGFFLFLLWEIVSLLAVTGRKLLFALCDLLFWAAAALGIFLFLLLFNEGRPDGYMLLGMAGSAAAFKLTLGAPLGRLRGRAAQFFRRRRRKAFLRPPASSRRR